MKAKDLDPRAPNGRAPFWSYALGEWWAAKGPRGGEPIPDAPGVPNRPAAQAIKPFESFSLMLPMRRLLGGLSVVWIETVDRLPVTAYPLLMPRVERSGLQPFGLIRSKYPTDTGVGSDGQTHAYPRALDANTRVDMRWRVGAISYGAGGGTGDTPGGARQAGGAIRRRALRVPRFSTIPRTADATQSPTNGGG